MHAARVAKRFRWEAAHRLPGHAGLCRHLHGHSYRMTIEILGEIGADGMVMDFQDIKRMVGPLIDAWDHATLVAEQDQELLEILQRTGWKHYVMPTETTAEHVASYAADHVCSQGGDVLRRAGVRHVRVRLEETETSYAEVERTL
jgi:6-pyruvoyltetrahydropterin/6-carboxytetrahydropterin synthase